MINYIIKRLLQFIPVFGLFLVLSFVLFNATPGNAFTNILLNRDLPPEEYARVIATFGLDKPVHERLFLYITNFFRGDFGYSYTHFPKTPLDLISEYLPRTLMLFAIVNIVAFYTGFIVGKILAWKRGTKTETWITMPYSADEVFFTMIKYTIVSSIVLFLVFVLSRNIESIAQRRNTRLTGTFFLIVMSIVFWNNGEAGLKSTYAWDIAFHMILPVLVVTFVAFAGTALLMRTTMMEVLKEDYILTARAKGLSQKRIRDRHAARTALLPVATSFIFTIITIVDGAVITENIFSWPGMGVLLLDSLLREDIPVAMACFSFLGVLALVAHLLADISYAYLDPRIRIQSQG